MHSRLTASHIGIIKAGHIVVDQRRAVQQLDTGERGIDDLGIRRFMGGSHREAKARTNAVSTGKNGVLHRVSESARTATTPGAGQSRLSSTVNNLTDNIANLSEARSRIQDADYTAETTALAKSQILSQASTAMLAQANQNQQNVLSLLR